MGYAPKTILVADDSETFMMYISILLQRLGFDVIPAENGAEALKLLAFFSPDIVLLDVEMPEMDGIETLKAIKENSLFSHLPVIMVTVDSDKATHYECIQSGCSAYLTKPMKISEMNKVLQEHVVYDRDKRRVHLRTVFEKKVLLTHSGVSKEHFSMNLSEGGIYLRRKDPMAVGTEVAVSFPLKDGTMMTLQGNVIYTKTLTSELFKGTPGMAIEFKNLSDHDSKILRNYIEELLTEGIGQ